MARNDATSLLVGILDAHKHHPEGVPAGEALEALRAGADPDARGASAHFGAVHAAAATDSLELLNALLERGANLDLKDGAGHTALRQAARAGALRVARVLLEHGAGHDFGNGKSGGTALHAAAAGGHPEIVGLLLDRGADPNATDASQATPLHAAVRQNGARSPEIVRLLLAKGARVNATYSEISPSRIVAQRTALHQAADSGSAQMAEILLQHGANPKAPDQNFDRPIHLAARQNHDAVIEVLLRHGDDVNRPGARKMSPLDAALEARAPDAVATLTARGGKPGKKTCFLAHAVYRAPADEERLAAFRRFRDERLLGSAAGRFLVGTYYRWGPPAADWVARRPAARRIARGVLDGVYACLTADRGDGHRRRGRRRRRGRVVGTADAASEDRRTEDQGL